MIDHPDSRTELEPRYDRASDRGVLATRIVIGFAQGVILYVLSRALPPDTVNDPISQVLFGLMVAAVFVPPFIELGVGTLRGRTLTLWAASAMIVTAALGAYVRIRQSAHESQFSTAFVLFFTLVPGLFVATVLLTDSLVEQRPLPSYQRHFETAWKYGIQLAMAQLFVLLFEGIFWFEGEIARRMRSQERSVTHHKRHLRWPGKGLLILGLYWPQRTNILANRAKRPASRGLHVLF